VWLILFAVVCLGIPSSYFAYNLWNADLSTDDLTSDASYEGDVRVAFKTSNTAEYTVVLSPTGFRRLEVRGAAIFIGTSGGFARVVGASLGMSHRLTASRSEAAREWIERPPLSFVRPSANGVVLRGSSSRGRFLEFTLLPRDGDVERLYLALRRAGARPAEAEDAAATVIP
jgi:hypothetical protein